MNDHLLIADVGAQGQRLDKWLAAALPELSRARIQQLLKQGHVTLGGRPASASQKLRTGQELRLHLPDAEPSRLEPEAIPLEIVFEDEHLLVIDKPAGMTVHPAPGAYSGTLVHALLAHCGDSLSGIGGEQRPGIVHRLDKDTSGLMVVAKHDAAHRALAAQLQSREMKRQYLGIMKGIPRGGKGSIEGPIGRHPVHRKKMAVLPRGGKEARTHWRLLASYPPYAALAEFTLDTGRTHQIRVHAAHIGHPLLGDKVYARALTSWPDDVMASLQQLDRQCLHAARLGLNHPASGERMEFDASPPADFRAVQAALEEIVDNANCL